MKTLKKAIGSLLRYKFQSLGFVFSGYAGVCMSIVAFWHDYLSFGYKLSAVVALIVGMVFTVVAHIQTVSDRNYAVLNNNGKDIAEFNYKFYNRLGRFIIYCHDFEFVTREKPQVRPVLMKKAGEGMDGNGNYALTIWVKADCIDTPNVVDLKAAGANVKIIPEYKMDANLVFSVWIHGDRKECILRDRSKDTCDSIVVETLTSRAHIVLLNGFIELLEACECEDSTWTI